MAAVWAKWREISGLLLNKGIPLAWRGMLFDACIRSVMLYGGKTWTLTKKLEGVLIGCDRRMLRWGRRMLRLGSRDKIRCLVRR